jgi:hypothetical protein
MDLRKTIPVDIVFPRLKRFDVSLTADLSVAALARIDWPCLEHFSPWMVWPPSLVNDFLGNAPRLTNVQFVHYWKCVGYVWSQLRHVQLKVLHIAEDVILERCDMMRITCPNATVTLVPMHPVYANLGEGEEKDYVIRSRAFGTVHLKGSLCLLVDHHVHAKVLKCLERHEASDFGGIEARWSEETRLALTCVIEVCHTCYGQFYAK